MDVVYRICWFQTNKLHVRLDSFLGETWATTFPTIYKLKYGLINFILISPHITVQNTIKVGSNVYILGLLNRIELVCSRLKSFKNCTPIVKLEYGCRLHDMFTLIVLQCSKNQTNLRSGWIILWEILAQKLSDHIQAYV